MNDSVVENYIQGKLRGEELRDFELMLEKDPELAREVAFQLNLKEALLDEKKEQIRKQLQFIEKENPSTGKTNPMIWWVAASLFALVALSLYWAFKPSSYQEIYLSHYTTPLQLETDRQRGEVNELSALETAYLNYDNKNFSEALKGFEQLLNQEPENSTLRFYLAICHMELQHFEEAEKTLLSIPASAKYYEAAQWYRSLCLLQLDKVNEAEVLLRSLSEKGSNYQEEALALLEKLR